MDTKMLYRSKRWSIDAKCYIDKKDDGCKNNTYMQRWRMDWKILYGCKDANLEKKKMYINSNIL